MSETVPSTLFALGVNHRTAPVEVREKLFLNDDEIRRFLALISKQLPECLVLSTCNRTEIYGITDSLDFDIAALRDTLLDFKGARGFVDSDHFFELISCSACQQLFSVATSIDSRVVGDLQILRQLRASYAIARDEGTTGKVLNQLVQRSFKVGKRTFTDTSIHDGAVSVSLAAVETAIGFFGSLRDRRALVLGAGETGRSAAEALLKKNVGSLIVANRTRSHAQELINALPAPNSEILVADFDEFEQYLTAVDIVITATGSQEPIVTPEHLQSLSHDVLVIDIAVPRDVNPAVAALPHVTLRNIDDVQLIINSNHERRLGDIPKVKKLIAHEMVDFLTWYYTLPLLPEFEGVRAKPSVAQQADVLRIKQFLSRNVGEIHKLYVASNGDFQQDLDSHIALVKKLRTMKADAFGLAA